LDGTRRKIAIRPRIITGWCGLDGKQLVAVSVLNGILRILATILT